jgi:hypothetical protein
MAAGWVDINDFNELARLVKNIQVYGNGYVKYHPGGISIVINEQDASGGTKVSWAKITAVTDSHNYTASIWTDRNETDPAETDKALYVYDIIDSLSVGDWIPVQASNITDKDYENIQQLGLL